jgi:DNA-binding transcriptional LysR family regulator
MADFNDADLNLLRVFQAILEERSLTRAGERLGLSQPAISYALGRLRALFDDPLFVRSPEGMLPTPTAQQLAVPLGRAIASIREALRHGEPFDPATSTREFHLSMTDVGEQFMLPPVCETLQRVAPGVTLAAWQTPLAEVTEQLRLGQLDLAIGNLPALKPHTHHALLFSETYVCMTRRRPGLPARRMTRDRFLEMKHVMVVSGESSHRTINDLLRTAGIDRRIALRVPHFSVVPQILLRTDWVATLPQRVAGFFNELDQFAIYALPVETPQVDVTVHWHETFDNDDGNRWLRELVVQTLRDL